MATVFLMLLHCFWRGNLIAKWCDKITTIGFGADGASVNMGKKAGVASKLKEDTPWLNDIHCLPPHLGLAMLELQRSCATVEKAGVHHLKPDMEDIPLLSQEH